MPARPLPPEDDLRRPRPARAARRAASGACALLAAACSDGPSGPAPTRAITLCATADWFAHRNDGGEWTRVRSTTGAHAFDATERLSLAWARQDPRAPFLRVEHVTAAQAEATYRCGPGDRVGPEMVSGTVRGLADGDYADMSWGKGPSASTSWAEPVFQLFLLDGSHDFVATRFPTRVTADRVDRVVVRRAQAYPAGGTIIVDFASSEALAPEEHALRFDGARSSVQVNFHTASGNRHVLQSTVVGELGSGEQPRTTTLYTVPAALLVAGDVHEVSLGGGDRSVLLYVRTPRDLATSYGPPAEPPVFTTMSTTPRPRVRATIASQPGYDATAYLFLQQATGVGTARRGITVYATREHIGGRPRSWVLEVPDLSGVEGWDAVVALDDAAFEWTVNVTGRPLLFQPRDATDGQVLRSATARGSGRP